MKYPSAIFKCSVCGYEEEIAEAGFKGHPEVAEAARYGHLKKDRTVCVERGSDLTMRFLKHVLPA